MNTSPTTRRSTLQRIAELRRRAGRRWLVERIARALGCSRRQARQIAFHTP